MHLISMSITDAAAGPSSIPAADQLPDDPATLKSMIVELLVTLHSKDRELEGVRHRLDMLLRRLYGPRGERFDPNQPLLFAELADAPVAEAAAPTTPEPESKRRCRPHGRRRLPENLPHESKHHELTAADRVCAGCGQERIDIGTDKSEQLEYRPASLIVIEHFVHKYVCPCCSKASRSQPLPQDQEPAPAAAIESPVPCSEPEPSSLLPHQSQTTLSGQPQAPMSTSQDPSPPSQESTQPTEQPRPRPSPGCVVISALKPEMPIAKGLPGPGLLAHLIVSKYEDHLPLYRLERIYERQGVFLPRSTTCDWLAACGQLLRPLYELMIAVVLQSRVIHTDDTPVKINDPPPGATDLGRFWTYLGDAAHSLNVFDFTPNHKRDGPQRFLKNFQGYLQADAFAGYDGLYLPNPRDGLVRIIEVACNAHARRKFYEARTSDAARSHQALAYYAQLYEIERQAAKLGFGEEQRRQMRQDLAVPILDKFRTWLDGQRADVLPKSPMGEAFTYALNQWEALRRYTEQGFLAIDNNVAEREMKRIAIGRKNWLFVGSVAGGKTAAVLMSFTSTCKRLSIDPWAYLQDVLTRLPTTPATQLADLLPHRWQAARQAKAPAPASPATESTS